MLKRIFDETIAGVDVDILFAMLMDSYILAPTRDDAKGSLGSQELLHVSWAQSQSGDLSGFEDPFEPYLSRTYPGPIQDLSRTYPGPIRCFGNRNLGKMMGKSEMFPGVLWSQVCTSENVTSPTSQGIPRDPPPTSSL